MLKIEKQSIAVSFVRRKIKIKIKITKPAGKFSLSLSLSLAADYFCSSFFSKLSKFQPLFWRKSERFCSLLELLAGILQSESPSDVRLSSAGGIVLHLLETSFQNPHTLHMRLQIMAFAYLRSGLCPLPPQSIQ